MEGSTTHIDNAGMLSIIVIIPVAIYWSVSACFRFEARSSHLAHSRSPCQRRSGCQARRSAFKSAVKGFWQHFYN